LPGSPAFSLFEILTIGIREIRKQLRRLYWVSLMGTIDKVPERNQIFEGGSHAAACDWEEHSISERRLEILCATKGRPGAPMQLKTEIVDAQGKTQICASDIAQEILGPGSGATISNVLVVGTDGSMPLKRTEIHLEAPEQVPAVFNLLSTALQNSGFEFHAARSSAIPAAEIWLTSPLDNQKKTWLSCGANRGKDGFRNCGPTPTLREARLNNPGSSFTKHGSR
jgi:hypothetical protein